MRLCDVEPDCPDDEDCVSGFCKGGEGIAAEGEGEGEQRETHRPSIAGRPEPEGGGQALDRAAHWPPARGQGIGRPA